MPGNTTSPGTSLYIDNWTENGTFSIGTFSHTVANFSVGTLFYVRASANGVGNTTYWGYGNEASFCTKPNIITGFGCSTSDSESITLVWTNGVGADETYIRGEEGGFPTDRADGIEIYSGNLSTYEHSGLASSTTWYYRAWAYDTDCTGTYSDDYVQDYRATTTAATGAATDLTPMIFAFMPLAFLAIAFWQQKQWLMIIAGVAWFGFGMYGLLNTSAGDILWIFGFLGVFVAFAVLAYAIFRMRDKEEPEPETGMVEDSWGKQMDDEADARYERKKKRWMQRRMKW